MSLCAEGQEGGGSDCPVLRWVGLWGLRDLTEPGLKSLSLGQMGLCLEDEAYGKNREPISQVRKDGGAIALV